MLRSKYDILKPIIDNLLIFLQVFLLIFIFQEIIEQKLVQYLWILNIPYVLWYLSKQFYFFFCELPHQSNFVQNVY
jgi:hypothetical protein